MVPPRPITTEAAEELLSESTWIRRLAARLVDRERRDDVVQDAWVAALSTRPSQVGNVRAWLRAVVRNVVRQDVRANEARRLREREACRHREVPPTDELAARAEQQRNLVDLVLGLDEPYKTTLLLRYFQDLSSEEIARRTGEPASTVRNRVRRGLEELRDRVGVDSERDRHAFLALAGVEVERSGLTALITGGVIVKAKMIACAAGAVGIGIAALWIAGAFDHDAVRRQSLSDTTVQSRLEMPEEQPMEVDEAALTNREAVPPVVERAAVAAKSSDLRGRVVDEANKPIEGALVTIVDLPRIGARMESTGVFTKSDGSGWFRFDGEHGRPGYVMAHVEQSGYVPGSVELVGQDDPVVVLRRAGVVRGRVLDRETLSPMENVRLSFGEYDWRDGAMHPIVTDAAGRFLFERAPRSEGLTVDVGAPGHVPVQREIPPLGESAERELEIYLSRGRSLAGVVRDHETGAPIAGAVISIDLDDVCVTNPRGRFEVQGLGDTKVTLEAKKEGYGVTHQKLDPASLVGGEVFELPLLAECVVEGRVLEKDGAPIRSALLILTIDRDIDRAAVAEKLLATTGRAVPAGIGFAELGNLHSTRTDEQGRYRIGGLSPHVQYESLYVTSIGDGRSLSASAVRFDAPGRTKTVDISFVGDTGTIHGRVTVNGAPVSSSVDWQSGSAQGLAFTDADGLYRLNNVVPGDVVLEVYVDGLGVSETAHVALAPNQQLEWNMDLELDTPTVSGRVVTESGIPLTDGFIFVRSQSGSVRTQGEIGKEGTFRLAVSAPEGELLYLVVQHGPRRSIKNVRAGESSIDFVVPDTTSLYIDVRAEEGGPAVQDLAFEWRDSGQERFLSLDASSASFVPGTGWALELPIGVLDLRVSAPLMDYAPAIVERIELTLARSKSPISVILTEN